MSLQTHLSWILGLIEMIKGCRDEKKEKVFSKMPLVQKY
jgi:hypothetical protein